MGDASLQRKIWIWISCSFLENVVNCMLAPPQRLASRCGESWILPSCRGIRLTTKKVERCVYVINLSWLATLPAHRDRLITYSCTGPTRVENSLCPGSYAREWFSLNKAMHILSVHHILPHQIQTCRQIWKRSFYKEQVMKKDPEFMLTTVKRQGTMGQENDQ